MAVLRLRPIAGILCVASCGNVPEVDARIRSDLVGYYALVFDDNDRDDDGALSTAEQEKMTDLELADWPDHGRPDRQYMKSYLLTELADADLDRDGQLTRAEYLAPMVDEFDCSDRDHDGRLSDDELVNQTMDTTCARSRPILIPPSKQSR